jgi:hypothetical protein
MREPLLFPSRGPCGRSENDASGITVWNAPSRRSRRACAEGSLGSPRNLGDRGGNAPHDSDCIGGSGSRMVCAQALLKLARWCQQRSQSTSGGEPCLTSRKSEFPPAHAGGGNVCGAGATLGDVVAGHASERPSNSESSRRSATTNAQDRAGGVA